MATRLILKKPKSTSHITYNTKNKSWKKRLLCAVGFVSFGIVASALQFVFIHQNPNMQDSFLMSGVEPIPTIHPDTLEVRKLREENKGLREFVSRGTPRTQDNITEQDTLEKTKVINAINKHLGGVLRNKGRFIYDICQPNKQSQTLVNPMLVAAKFMLESANGQSEVIKMANNPSGINWNKGRYNNYPIYSKWYVKFASLDEGISDSVELLRKYYIEEGLTDIVSIGNKWAPPDDYRNGIGGMDNKSWAKNVTEIYEKILNDSK